MFSFVKFQLRTKCGFAIYAFVVLFWFFIVYCVLSLC